MNDCARLGHPNIDGSTCPCGERVFARRRPEPLRPTFHYDWRVWNYDPRHARRAERRLAAGVR